LAAARPTSRLTGDERRDKILDAARTVFARRGYHGASTAEIAIAAGCSEPMLYKHFASKQGLFVAALQEGGMAVKAKVMAAVGNTDHPMRAMAEVSSELLTDPRWGELMRMRALAVTMADDPEIGAALRSSIQHHSATVAGVARQAQAQDQVRHDVDAEMIGWIGVAISLLAAYRHALEGEEGLRDTARVMRALLTLVSTEEEEAP
jgi:AcrR family transcriptional regulator